MTPGESVASWTKVRPFKGNSTIFSLSIDWVMLPDSVCNNGASPETVTLSLTRPTAQGQVDPLSLSPVTRVTSVLTSF